MKHDYKKKIIALLNGDTTKQEITICDTYNCEPGFYRHEGKVINEAELSELKKYYNNTVIFMLKE